MNGTDEIVDEMGTYLHGLGLPRAAGRLLGYLMACVPAEQTAGEIGAGTGMSLASISANARLLQGLGAIEPRSRPGDRRTHYRVRGDIWMELARERLRSFEELARVARRIERGNSVTRTDAIDEMVAFAAFWAHELPGLGARWDAIRASLREGS